MELTFSANITAADTKTRTIMGQLAPFGSIGNTSVGQVMFEAGSIHIPDGVKVLLEHDQRRPVGRLIATHASPGGIMGELKISATTAGNDLLIEAAEGLRDGISVGASVDKYKMVDGVMRVTAATLVEVSLVTNPAFTEARVTQVAASEPETTDGELPEGNPNQEETMDEQTSAPVEAEAVTASAVPVQASQPVAYSTPRSPVVNGVTYLEHAIKAARGNEDSRQFVMAADDSLSNNTGFNPVEYLNEFVGSAQREFGRPTIEACGGATPHQFIGTTISIPKVGTAPTVASTAEGVAPSETGMTSSYLTGTATKYAGLNRFSVELFDLNASPAFYTELMNEMVAAYAKATNAAVIAAITAGGTQAATTAASSAGIISFVSVETPAAYAGTGYFPNAYIAGASQWGLMLGAVDTTGRPIYNAYVPQNAGGVTSPSSARGNVLGLDLYVDNGMVSTTIDESAFIVAPNSIGIYEQAPRTLQVNQLGSLEIEVSMHGYLATIIKRATGLRRFNLT